MIFMLLMKYFEFIRNQTFLDQKIFIFFSFLRPIIKAFLIFFPSFYEEKEKNDEFGVILIDFDTFIKIADYFLKK